MNQVHFLGLHEKVQIMLFLYAWNISVEANAYINSLLSNTQITLINHGLICVSTGAEPLEMCWEKLWEVKTVAAVCSICHPGQSQENSLIFLTFVIIYFFLNHKKPICNFSLKRYSETNVFSRGNYDLSKPWKSTLTVFILWIEGLTCMHLCVCVLCMQVFVFYLNSRCRRVEKDLWNCSRRGTPVPYDSRNL